MADFGDFKEPTPAAAAETFSMPPRDTSLDDFEKLDNFSVHEKPESDIQVGHDILDLNKKDISPEISPVSSDPKPTQIFEDPIRPTKHFEEEEEEEEEYEDNFQDNVITSFGNTEPHTDLLGFESVSENNKPVTPQDASAGTGVGSLLDFEIPASAPTFEAVSSKALHDQDDDDFRAGFQKAEKLVHPHQEAPSDSGYGPSPSDETAVGKDAHIDEVRFDKIVPSAPEIAPAVADSLVSDKHQTRRSPSPVEIPKQQEIPQTKAAAPTPAPTYTAEKMTNDEVSSTKEQAGPASCPFSPSALFDTGRLHPRVTQLVYWHDPKKSGGVFGGLLLLLLSMRFFSFISVISYLALGVLSVTLSFRIYKNILQAVQKSGEGHPFKEYLEYDLNVSQDKLHETADILVKHVNCTLQKLRSLFLVEDLVDSIKLGIVLWSLTYLGAWFNGLTLIILGVIAFFTLPKLYESNQTLIDQYISLASAQVSGVLSVVKSKIPFGKKEKSQ